MIVHNKKKKTYWIVDFTVSADDRVKIKESEKRDKYPDLAWEFKKTMEHEVDGNTNCNRRTRYTRNNLQGLGKGTGRFRNQKTSWDHPYYSIVKIDHNTEKNSEDLRRLTATQDSSEKPSANHIYPTPALGQDMTQGRFLSGVKQVWIQSFSSPRLVASPRLKNSVCPTIYPSLEGE